MQKSRETLVCRSADTKTSCCYQIVNWNRKS